MYDMFTNIRLNFDTYTRANQGYVIGWSPSLASKKDDTLLDEARVWHPRKKDKLLDEAQVWHPYGQMGLF